MAGAAGGLTKPDPNETRPKRPRQQAAGQVRARPTPAASKRPVHGAVPPGGNPSAASGPTAPPAVPAPKQVNSSIITFQSNALFPSGCCTEGAVCVAAAACNPMTCAASEGAWHFVGAQTLWRMCVGGQ